MSGTEKGVGSLLKSANQGKRALAREALKDSTVTHAQWMLGGMLLDRISNASQPFDPSRTLQQRHYIKPPSKIPDAMQRVFTPYTNWNKTLEGHLKDWSDSYGIVDFETESALEKARGLSFESGRLRHVISDMGEAFHLNERKAKVNNTENNFLYAAVGLIALMLVSPLVHLYTSIQTDYLFIREILKGRTTGRISG